MHVLRSVPVAPEQRVLDPTLVLGFLLLSAYLAGKLTAAFGLPRITGYILLGVLVGPSVLGLVTDRNRLDLALLDSVAVSLIALSAGGELKVAELRRRMASLTAIVGFEMTAVFLAVGGAVVLLAGALPFTAGRPLGEILVIAMMFGSIAIANSPSVAIAVINDTRSSGPVTSTILGVTVLKDVAVIVFFAIALSVARAVLSAQGGLDAGFLKDVAWEIGGSLALGALIGAAVSFYLRRVRVRMVFFALAVAFLSAFIAAELHLEVLLTSLTAGFFVENISPVDGEPFVEAIEANSMPVYALFFSLAGASIHLADLVELWPIALGLVSIRAAAVFGGTWLGARVSNAEPEVRRYAWLGFISQAGVTLGLVVIAARAFPAWGDELRTLFVAMVAIHELIGPLLLQWALSRSGETGKRQQSPA